MPPHEPENAMLLRPGVLLAPREVRGDCTEWDVEVAGRPERAVSFAPLAGPLRAGDRVLLNTTAAALTLGTGGVHFVVARLEATEPADAFPFPGREAGHILKLRYTPLQHRVLAAEEEASPHREAVERCASLDGMPVLVCELHSQAAAAALAARSEAPGLRIAWVQADTAALPLGFSRLVHRLRSEGVLDATVTTGQAFGGNLEAVNLHSGLAVARAAARADLAIVTQGPGNAGTGTPLGFSGLSLIEALHAAAALGGVPVLAARMSDADPRSRHRGLSHHTETMLRCLLVPVTVPAAEEDAGHLESDPGVTLRHRVHPVRDVRMQPLEPYRDMLTSMGRTLEEDALFFRCAAAAGVFAARLARETEGEIE